MPFNIYHVSFELLERIIFESEACMLVSLLWLKCFQGFWLIILMDICGSSVRYMNYWHWYTMTAFRMWCHFMISVILYPQRMQHGWYSVRTHWNILRKLLCTSIFFSSQGVFFFLFSFFSVVMMYRLDQVPLFLPFVLGKIGPMHSIWENSVKSLDTHMRHHCHIMIRLLLWIH